jgi:hypothetical protein
VAKLAVRGDDIDGFHVVERETKASREAPKAAAEREAADPGVRYGAGRRHQAVRHRFVIQLA